MSNPSSSVNFLLETSKEFNDAAERVASVIQALDEKIERSGIGTAIYLDNTETDLQEDEGGKTFVHELGYDRSDFGWAISVRSWCNGKATIRSLKSASRNLRLHFIAHVPALLKLLEQKAAEQLEQARKQKATIEGLEKLVADEEKAKIGPRPDGTIGRTTIDPDKAWSAKSLLLPKTK